MRIAIHTRLSDSRPWFEHADRYWTQVLPAIAEQQPDLDLVLYTPAPYGLPPKGYTRVSIPATIPPRHLERRVVDDRVDILLSPIEFPLDVPIPQIPYVLDVAVFEQDNRRGVHGLERNVRRVCHYAPFVLVTSQFLKRRCLDLFDVPLNKSIVAPPGVSALFREPQDGVFKEPYFVTVLDGFTYPYLDKVFDVFARLAPQYGSFGAVVVGQYDTTAEPNWNAAVLRAPYLGPSVLAGLYQYAFAFIYPALHDGSALRVLEALGAGTPVICSSTGALRELAVDVPLYAVADDERLLASNIRRLLHYTEQQRYDLAHKGIQLARRYSWATTAATILRSLAGITV